MRARLGSARPVVASLALALGSAGLAVIAPTPSAAGPPASGVCQTGAIDSEAGDPDFNAINRIAVDADGNVYTSDFVGAAVYRFDSTGTQTLVIEAGDATPNLTFTEGVDVDAAGNIYVADRGTDTVYRFDSTGTQTLAIPPTAATPNLSQPKGVAVDGDGNIYVADGDNDSIHRFDSTGTQTLVIPATATTPQISFPSDVDVDAAGNIYTTDFTTDTVYRFSSAGAQDLAIPATAATPNLAGPEGVGTDADGNIYVTDTSTDTVHRFDSAGAQTLAIDATDAAPNFANPTDVAVDVLGGIHVSDSSTRTLHRFLPDPTALAVTDETQYRVALECASAATSGPITIRLGDTVTLIEGTDPTYTGSADLVIEGDGHHIFGSDTSRLLRVSGGAGLTVRNTRMRRALTADGEGGAINSDGSVTVVGSSFEDNATSNGDGGAVAADGTVTVVNSTFVHNEAESQGGAIYALTVVVTNSTIADNTAPEAGGGISGVSVRLDHATVASNTAPTGANIETLTLGQKFASVIADPQGGLNCSQISSTASEGHNYADDLSCGLTDVDDNEEVANDARLGPARHNGDLTAPTEATGDTSRRPTMFPLAGSPLIDAIPTAECSADVGLDVDERGLARPFGAGCDIGAIEAVFPAHGFSDVTPFYESSVRWVTSTVNTPQILSGFDDGTFRQTANITRGQAVRMLYRAAGAPDVSTLPDHGFTDVIPFFDDAVTWAKDRNVFSGFSDDTFRHHLPISRGNLTRAFYAFAGLPTILDPTAHGFSDVTPFYDKAVTWAKTNGLADGFGDNTFRQTRNITRGNATRIFSNVAQTPDAWKFPHLAPANMLFSPLIF